MRATSRTPGLLATVALVGGLVAGCGGSGSGSGSGSPGASSSGSASASASGAATGESGMDMDMGSADSPSEPASMICGDEIQDAVRRTFAMTDDPTGTSSWDREDRVFSCSWRVPNGRLAMSVQDATDPRKGRAHFADLRSQLQGARTISGMGGFGFPAFQTRSGNVAFLKDGKTLRVDATSLSDEALPAGYSRSETAYSVAAAVIACWSE